MNWIDLLLIVVIVLSVIAGFYRGFIIGSISLLSWTGSLLLAFLFYPYTAQGMDKIMNVGPWLLPLAFIITAVIARIIIGVLARLIFRSIPDSANRTLVNRFLGIIPGAINGWLYAVIISALLLALPLKNNITTKTRESALASRFAVQAEWANQRLAPVFDDAVRQTINSLTLKPGTEESVDLTFKYDKGVARPSMEVAMLEMVNKERAKAGLKPLKADPELTFVARAQSQDMLKRGYFAHINPEGRDPFDRMRAANISFRAAGENLALAQSLEIAHKNLMNSPGHRANILNPSYGRLGIGVIDAGFYGLMISQEFRD
jgi:uncharacterized protein YkwD